MIGITYGQLDKVLHSLGFASWTTTLQTEAQVYEHQETGALIILPVSAEDKEVLPPHFAVVQGTLKEYGIADPLDLATELQKAN